MSSEQGITLGRIYDLIRLHEEMRRMDLYELGATINQAVMDPKNLRRLQPKPAGAQVQAEGMLKPVRRKSHA